jgi:hypothetical protein
LVRGAAVCVVGLDTNANFTVGLQQAAEFLALNCAVYSNSTNPNRLFAKNSALLKAVFICSSGGKSGAGFSPTPQTDAPRSQIRSSTALRLPWAVAPITISW